MANDSNLRGLRPVNQPFGTVKSRYYTANTAIAIYLYQPLALNNSGQVEVDAVGDNSDNFVGVALGFLDTNKGSLPSGINTLADAPYLPASKEAVVLVSDDPNQEYIVEEDTGGTALTTTAIGNTCSFTYLATTGNTTTGVANVVLDRSDVAADSAGLLKIVALGDTVNSDGSINAAGDYGKWIVRAAHHVLGVNVSNAV